MRSNPTEGAARCDARRLAAFGDGEGRLVGIVSQADVILALLADGARAQAA